MRYKVVEGSQSAHCCFAATVVDTIKPEMVHNGQQLFETVCECFEKDAADRIAEVLNRMCATLAALEADIPREVTYKGE